MSPTITISSYDNARLLLRDSPNLFTHVVSINDPENDPPPELESHGGRHLILSFHDRLSPGYQPPTRRDVTRILQFARSMDSKHHVLVHCMAGISQSSAAALAILASNLDPSPRNALLAVRQVREIKLSIFPHRIIVSLADELLEYRGALIEACHSTWVLNS
jgi:predicted protein tyrosine phosphatase